MDGILYLLLKYYFHLFCPTFNRDTIKGKYYSSKVNHLKYYNFFLKKIDCHSIIINYLIIIHLSNLFKYGLIIAFA